jgi:hypothetical protein
MQAWHSETLDFVDRSGKLLGTKNPGMAFLRLIGRQTGFIGRVTASTQSWLDAWDDSGDLLAVDNSQVGGVAEDPLGGIVALKGQLTSYDDHLVPRWRASLPPDNPDPVGLAVDRSGNTLYLFDGTTRFGENTVAGIWFDHSGAAGSVFQMLGPQQDRAFRLPFVLTARVGSGLFLSLEPSSSGPFSTIRWISQIDSLATSASPAPAWLQARPSTRLHMVHGGTAYAVLPVEADTQDCAQTVEVINASGTSCGTAKFRAAQGVCRTGSIIVGYDGTVVQLAPDPDPAHHSWFGQATCYWHWWPGFFGD